MKKVLFIGFLMLFAFAQFAFATELLTNEGFENWTVNGATGPPDDWNLSGTSITGSQETTNVHGGTYSTNITWTTTSTRYLRQQAVPVTEGTNYLFTFWALDNDPDGRVRVAIRWYDAGSGFVSGYYGDYSADSPDWQQMSSGLQAAPATAVTADIEIRVYDVSGWDGEATVYVDDASFTASTTVEISKAYSISDSEIDVFYTNDVTSVNAADYTLTGTATITFSGATIDGSDAKIVHLTGASATVDGDRTLDNIDDSANGDNYDFYAGIMPIAYTNTNIPDEPVDGTHFATYTGIISAHDGYNNVWLHDNFGAYNGIMIYDSAFDNLVAQGDEILVFGKRSPYYSLTELVDPELISIISSGNNPYDPTVINGSDIEETLAADTNPGEIYEGQLCKIENFVVDSYVAYDYRCSWTDPVTRDTYYFHVGDNVDYHFGVVSLDVGSTYTEIVGVVDWDNGGPYYRINPRDANDYILYQDTTAPTIAGVTVTDENTVEVMFDEEVEEITAETTAFYTIVARDVTVTGAVLDAIDATHVTLSVTGMTVGSYTLSAVGVEDLAGNPSDDSYNFSYIIPPAVGDVIVNEIMQNPSAVYDSNGEYVEFYNTTDHDIDINGWTVRDKDYDSFIIDNGGPLIIVSYDYLVMGLNGDPLQNGGYVCDYVYSGMSLGNSSDEVILEYGRTIIDSVYYDNGATFPDPNGSSMELNPAYMNYIDNDDGANWYEAATPFGDGDNGTPGSANPGPAPDPPTNIAISEDGINVTITWDVIGGLTYNVYSDTDPYGTFGTPEETGNTTGTFTQALDTKKFYMVTANN